MGFADFDIMGKCKKILSKMDLLSEDIGNTLTPLVGVLGTTADTGGTETAGTAMAKLNTLIGINLEHGSAEFTTAGTHTWACPEGVGLVYVAACAGSGGGGGGGGGKQTSGSYYGAGGSGGGGGGASNVINVMLPVESGKVYTIKIGAGGAGGSGGAKKIDLLSDGEATKGGAGGAGGDTTFDNLFTVKGGAGGGGGGAGKNDDSSFTSNAGGSGGAKSKDVIKNIHVSPMQESTAATDGAKTKVEKVATITGGAGGAGGTNALEINGGAGGAGGTSTTYDAYYNPNGVTNGSNGGSGKAGYVKIIW